MEMQMNNNVIICDEIMFSDGECNYVLILRRDNWVVYKIDFTVNKLIKIGFGPNTSKALRNCFSDSELLKLKRGNNNIFIRNEIKLKKGDKLTNSNKDGKVFEYLIIEQWEGHYALLNLTTNNVCAYNPKDLKTLETLNNRVTENYYTPFVKVN